MTTVIKLVIASILGLLMSSCHMDFGVKGNGNVTTTQRNLNGNYDEIEVSRGLDVYLTQAESNSINVQSDENLQDIIITEIEGNVLKIYAKENISFSEAQKVMVNFKNVSKISASSGSDVYSTNTLNLEALELSTDSGSDMNLSIDVQSLDCSTSSGSDLHLSGMATQLTATASSGSDIDAYDLKVETSNVKASSGADIKINTSKVLLAKASSGGDISYKGNPDKIEKSDGVSRAINQD